MGSDKTLTLNKRYGIIWTNDVLVNWRTCSSLGLKMLRKTLCAATSYISICEYTLNMRLTNPSINTPRQVLSIINAFIKVLSVNNGVSHR